jgi:hypothetical protein
MHRASADYTSVVVQALLACLLYSSLAVLMADDHTTERISPAKLTHQVLGCFH